MSKYFAIISNKYLFPKKFFLSLGFFSFKAKQIFKQKVLNLVQIL